MSDTPKHSPGPFTHKGSKKKVGKFGYEIEENSLRDSYGCLLLRETYGPSYTEDNTDRVSLAPGDWHLFAAAPEMLEALKDCRDLIENMPVEELLMQVEAAIAKAEGRVP
jgi:hypothetical protein